MPAVRPLTRLALFTVLISLLIMISNCGAKMTKADRQYVTKELAKLAPVELKCDLSKLPASEYQALTRLIEAGRIIDQIFLIQVNPDNPKLEAELNNLIGTPDSVYYQLFRVMFGPWNRIDENRPFYSTQTKPLGAGFYPPDLTKEEFQNWLDKHPEDKAAFESNFTIIQRQKEKLVAVPYHQAYAEYLTNLVNLLKEAAEITQDQSLRKYLQLRAADLLTDDYFQSDLAWMDLSGDLEIVIGPYEVYEDQLFNYKAAYEAFICVVDHDESRKLAEVSQHLDELEQNLPLPAEHRHYSRGKISPIKVVTEIFSAGDTKAGIQTTAFNLPNDERVRAAKGSKKVMLKNIAEAKYEKCWIPIVKRILAPEVVELVSFEAYFTHVLMHEISHGLGPGILYLSNGEQTTVAKQLKETYSTIEECKADVVGIDSYLYLINRGIFPKDQKKSALASYLGGMFRSIRFGIDEAHGGGVAIQFNYLVEKGAFKIDTNGKLTLDYTLTEKAIRDLAATVLLIEATGDYQSAIDFITRYRQRTPLIAEKVEQLSDLPIDIRPIFPIEKP